jgi:hypothetical protein
LITLVLRCSPQNVSDHMDTILLHP